jgi:PAS domain S-box-containing protein
MEDANSKDEETNKSFSDTNPIESLEFYKDFIEYSSIAFLKINKEKKIHACNFSAASLFGYEKPEFLNLNIFKIFSQMKIEVIHEDEFIKKFMNNELIENLEAKVRKKNGDLIWLKFSIKPIFNNQGELVGNYFVGLDISKKKIVESELINSDEKYKSIFHAIKSGVVVYESKNEGKEFIIKDFNKAAEKIEGVTKEDVIGKNILSVFPGVKNFGLLEMFQRVWKTGIPEKHPLSYYTDNRINGWRENYIYKLSSGEIVAIYDNLTEKVSHDQILSESVERFRLITSSANDAIIQMDHNGKIIFWNIAAETIFGYSADEILGKDLHIILAPDRFQKSFLYHFPRFITSGTGGAIGKTVELAGLKKDGNEIPIELSLSGVKIKGNWNAIGIIRDISERKIHEKSLNQVLNFEKLMTSISSRFVGNIDFDKAIDDTLKSIGISKMLSRVYLFSFDEDKEYMMNTHEWCDEGIDPHMEFYKETPLIEFPVAMDNIFQGGYLSVEDSSNLTKGAIKLKKILSERNVKATLAYPIYIHNKISGFIGFDDEINPRFWNPEDYSLLKITSQIIGNVLERKVVENNLKESEEKYRLISEDSDDLIVVYNDNLSIDYLNENTHSRVLGYHPRLFWKQTFRNSLVHKDDLKLSGPTIKKGYEKGSYKLHLRFRHINGHYLWFQISGKTFHDKNGEKKLLVVGREITDIKLAEQKTKDSEETFKSLFEESPFSIVLIDLDGRFIDCNPANEKIFGWQKSDLIGTKFFEVNMFPEEYLPIVSEAFSMLQKNFVPEPFEVQSIRKNGVLIWTRIQSSFISVKNQKLIQVTSQDIDGTKKAQQKLLESRHKLKERVKELNVLFEISKTIEKQNLSMKQFFHEIMKNIPPAWRYPNLLCSRIAYKNKIFSSNNFQETNWKLSSSIKIGTNSLTITVFYLENKAFLKEEEQIIDEIAVRLKAILEQKEFETKLKLSEGKYRNILESIKEGYYEVDLNGNFTFINDAICEITGYNRDEIINSNYSRFCDVDTSKYLLKEFSDLYNMGKGFKILEYQQINKNKDSVYLETSLYLRLNSNNDIIGFKGVVRNITERKKSEALRKQFNQRLEEEVELRTIELAEALDKQKLYLDQIIKASHFKTEFLATMSHELRTPLNAIIGFTDLLLENVYGKLNAEQLEFVNDIKSSAEHQFEMISHILDISKIESGQTSLKIESLQLKELIESIVSTLKPFLNEKDLKLEMKGFEKKIKIKGDRLKIKQIVYNLITNAIKFTIKGSIVVEFRDIKTEWEIKVIDSGIGIAEEDFDIIFKDFKRVKSKYVDSTPGSGLGLALTKRIVELHGGQIQFESTLGEGSCFSFTIPKDTLDLYKYDEIEQFLKRL